MANMKTSFAVAGAVLMIGLNAMGGEPIKNVLTDIPYADDHLGKRQLVDEKHLLVMQVALKPGQQVPQHNANSNVYLLVVEGQIMVTLEGKDTVATKGDILPIAFKTLMGIRNVSKENASFLILKSPNPSEMKP
jgi:quercetin dioxygenase-like cupin family protein